jgi:hypothetical protein
MKKNTHGGAALLVSRKVHGEERRCELTLRNEALEERRTVAALRDSPKRHGR